MRKIIIAALGIVLIIIAFLLASYFIKNKNKPKPKFDKAIKTVTIDTVINKEIPIVITASGNLVAKNKIELYAEVQGIMQPTRKEFKAGTSYRKGEILLLINSDEFYASLQSQKSNLFNLITSILPDIRLDYPNQFTKWNNYLKSFDINKTVPKLPTFDNDQEKYFISGRGIISSYYNVKNLEVKLNKYSIRAPYNGIVTEALVTPGTLVRNGQKLGEFIEPKIYEVEVSVNAKFTNLLKVGNPVTLHNLERTNSYQGKVVRLNGKVDLTSQTIKAYIQVVDKELKEGVYLEADLTAKAEKDAYEISRKLLINNNSVYVVKDSLLDLIKVNPVYFKANSVVIKGLPNNTLILSQTLPGSYVGMPVKINSTK